MDRTKTGANMAVTKEQWEEIEQRLSGSFGRVELLCDGYKITASIGRIAPLKFAIEVYVDGVIKGEWMDGESEIPRKFHQQRTCSVNSAKQRAGYLKLSKSKLWTKEERDRWAEMANSTISMWYPYWTNAKAFCRHIRKTCTSIELVKIGF